MSLALIQESAKEVRRLAIAGSSLAVGDFRLKKLVTPLEQAGAKVPVFAQVAAGINTLVNGKETESAANLLQLSTLLNAILYTQGQTGTEGDWKELELCATRVTSTRTPARVLKPIIEALTSTGSGRFEVVESALERGAFSDLRLIEPSLRALEDIYPELADLVASKILPNYGPGIIPLLKKKFDLKGKKSDARRLAVMYTLDPVGMVELCRAAVDGGSPDVKVQAIACLAHHDDCLELLLEQAKGKNKTVREAALKALAQIDRPETAKLFKSLLQGKTEEISVESLRTVKNREVFCLLLSEAGSALEKALNDDGVAIVRFAQLLQCLRGRSDGETEKFLLSSFAQFDKLAKAKGGKDVVLNGQDLVRMLVEQLHALETPQALEAILARRDKLPRDCFRVVFSSALQAWSADKVFGEFSPLLAQTKGAGKSMSEEIQRVIWASHFQREVEYDDIDRAELGVDFAGIKKIQWDPRWIDAAIKADQYTTVCYLAGPGHKEAVAYLLKSIENKNRGQSEEAMQALARCGYPKLTDLFLELVKARGKKAQGYDWEFHQLLRSARFLPAADLPKLDAFAATLDEKLVDSFLEALAPLRTKTSSQSNNG